MRTAPYSLLAALGWVSAAAAATACVAYDEAGDLPELASGTDLPGCAYATGSGCETPAPGCPCTEEGERIACDDVYSEVADQVVCGSGDAVCEDGRYGECILNGNIKVGKKSAVAPLALGGPESCKNPCDKNCTTFYDDPSGLDDPDAGISSGPGGLTLPGEEGLVEAPCSGGTSGTCAHSICEVGAKLKTGCDATQQGEPSCVTKVCAIDASCCNATWGTHCTDLLATACGVTCYEGGGQCFACYKDNFDHDGDGYTGNAGDCLDCDSRVNAGAYDFPGNGIDENCDGVPDNEVTVCDAGLSLASTNAVHHAQAIDLCRQTTSSATGKNRTWGVTAAHLLRATGSSAPHDRGYAIQTSFGPNNTPKQGTRMAVYSSGTARTPGQSGYVNPNGQYSSYDAGTSVNYPPGFPKNAQGCPTSGNKANDSSGLRLKIRTPTNAKSFSYHFSLFSTEYPEWVCTAYNDHFVALLTGSSALPQNPPQNSNNISFDKNGNPVSVNVAFFTHPGCPTCTSNLLTGTGFDGTCASKICGGSTGWLYTTAPVVGGEEITLQFAVWDQGDALWDSTVLVDNFRWSVEPSAIETGVEPPEPSATTYEAGVFVRDYDASKSCKPGQTVRWGHWSWQAQTPSDTRIRFSIQAAATAAGLDAAPEDALQFSDPPGPSALVGLPAVAGASPNTKNGSAVVDTTLESQGRPRWYPHLRVISRLDPSSDALAAPTLAAWNLQFTCVEDE